MKKIENAEIKRLLKKGFNPELISFEFDVSLEQVKQCQNEIENSKKKYAGKIQFKKNERKI